MTGHWPRTLPCHQVLRCAEAVMRALNRACCSTSHSTPLLLSYRAAVCDVCASRMLLTAAPWCAVRVPEQSAGGQRHGVAVRPHRQRCTCTRAGVLGRRWPCALCPRYCSSCGSRTTHQLNRVSGNTGFILDFRGGPLKVRPALTDTEPHAAQLPSAARLPQAPI